MIHPTVLPTLAAIAVLAGALAPSLPAAAQARGADGNWQCTALMGTVPVAFVGLRGSGYTLTLPDGTSAKGKIAYSDSPIISFTVESGALADRFDAAEGILMGDDRLMFDGASGGIALMCAPGVPGKM